MHYETADKNRGNTEILAFVKELRNLPEDVSFVENDWETRTCTYVYKNGRREAHSIDSIIGKRTQVADKAPTREKKNSNLTKSFKDTANKCNNGIQIFKDRINQIDRDIIALSSHGLKADNYDAITKLNHEKQDLLARIEKLKGIRKDCLKQVVT